MLIQYKFQNFLSFNSEQTLSLVASTSTKERHDDTHVIDVNAFGIESLLKSVAIFGANASGKSNFTGSLGILKYLVLRTLGSITSDRIQGVIPFFIKDDPFDVPTEFEVAFIQEGKSYRYGLAISEGVVAEEWLYWTKDTRETLLFHRTAQRVEFNQRSFAEAKPFVSSLEGGGFQVEKTKPTVPFVSVISSFNGVRSNQVTEWFRRLQIVSGTTDDGVKDFTTDLFQQNPEFKSWALKILASVQIQDIEVVEEDGRVPDALLQHEQLAVAVSSLDTFIKANNIKHKRIDVIKSRSGNQNRLYKFPFVAESEGTRKLLYLLGPLYQTIRNGDVLVIDEFDNKFHTLLSEFLITLYNRENCNRSQLILTCHDTNLLDKRIFRRDQIWFVEKNNNHESELFSLLEYREHYTRKEDSYSRDYLAGKYGAIPLFESANSLDDVCDG